MLSPLCHYLDLVCGWDYSPNLPWETLQLVSTQEKIFGKVYQVMKKFYDIAATGLSTAEVWLVMLKVSSIVMPHMGSGLLQVVIGKLQVYLEMSQPCLAIMKVDIWPSKYIRAGSSQFQVETNRELSSTLMPKCNEYFYCQRNNIFECSLS
jgi:hypothetical protein